jgi:uncharacterized protein
MDISTLEVVLNRIYENDKERKKSKIIWHGGEPSLMGMAFYRKVITLQLKYKGHYFENAVQTNCAMHKKDVIDFWIDNGFKIGVSLDGQEFIHSKTRVYKNGKSSFPYVMGNIEYLKSRDVKFGLISVINSYSVHDPLSYYKFIKDISPNSVRVNPLIPIGNAIEHDNIHVTPHQYGSFLINLFDAWINDDKFYFMIEPLSDMLQALITKKSRSCAFLNDCTNFFVGIDPHGNISPCGRLSKDDFFFGNVMNLSISEALNSKTAERFRINSSQRLNECNSCNLLAICNGGCFSNAILLGNLSNTIPSKDYYCESYKMIYEHMYATLCNQKKEMYNGSAKYSIVRTH